MVGETSPKITMPSFKKRVHSQRIPQRERPAVTPYDGAYDQKYSSDEDNVEYEVDEPEEAMERSNSSVTFSEDIYDSDTIDEMMKNQIQKSTQVLHEGFFKSEGTPNVLDIGLPKSILKDGKEKGGSKKNESLINILPETKEKMTSLIDQKKISLHENESEADSSKPVAATEAIKLTSDALPSEKVKTDEKGEKFLPDLTKPTHGIEIKETHKITDEISPAIDKSEVVTKSLRSTIPQQIDQITDSATTNKDDFVKKDEKVVQSVTKPLQDASSKDSCAVTPLNVLSKDIITDEFVKSTTQQPDKKSVNEAWKQELISFSKETEELLEKATLTREKCHLSDDLLDLDHETFKQKGKNVIQSENDVQIKVSKQNLIDHKKIKSDNETVTDLEIVNLIQSQQPVDEVVKDNLIEKSNETKEKDVLDLQAKQIMIQITPDSDEASDSDEAFLKDSTDAEVTKTTVLSREDVTKKAEEFVNQITQIAEHLISKKLDEASYNKDDEAVLFESLINKSEKIIGGKNISEDVVKEVQDFIKNESHVISASPEKKDTKKREIDEIIDTKKPNKPFTEITSEEDIKTKKDLAEIFSSPEIKNFKSDKEFKLLNEKTCDVVAAEKEIACETSEFVQQMSGQKSEAVPSAEHKTEQVDDAQEIVLKSNALEWTAKPSNDHKDITILQQKIEHEVNKQIPKDLNLIEDVFEEKSSQINEKEIKREQISALETSKQSELTDNVTSEENEGPFTAPQIVSEKQIEQNVNKSLAQSPTNDSKKKEDKFKDLKQEESNVYFASSGSTRELDNKNVEVVQAIPSSIWSNLSSGITSSMQDTFTTITGISSQPETLNEITLEKPRNESEEVASFESPATNLSAEAIDVNVIEESKDVLGTELESPDSDSQPRVIFRIESEDEYMSDAENDWLPTSNPSSPTREFGEKIKKELKASFEKEQKKLEQRLASMKSGIFDISRESLSRTKELVDERLRKISEIKPPKNIEDVGKKEKSETKADIVDEIKIGRFHITPAPVDEVVANEAEISERLKATRKEDEVKDEMEKELPEKLTEADFEEVIRELQLEGLKTEVFFQPEGKEKEEKKERTLKRVERRFERMASETLEKEKEEEDSVSAEKLDEKREVEFQRMLSQLSSEEVAESQQEYLQLWEEGGLSSLTPTDDWESRDPDTPENELEDDSTRKPESYRGSQESGKHGEPTKASEPKKLTKHSASLIPAIHSSKPAEIIQDETLNLQTFKAISPVKSVSSPTEIDREELTDVKSEEIPTYDERKRFWEKMSSSQSGEPPFEIHHGSIESVGGVASSEEINKPKKSETGTIDAEIRKSFDEGGLVKSLTESFTKKIAEAESVKLVTPTLKSLISKEGLEVEADAIAKAHDISKLVDSPGTDSVSELEVKLKLQSPSVPITESAVISGDTELDEQILEKAKFTTETSSVKEDKIVKTEHSTDSEAEFLAKYGVESLAFDNTMFTDDEDVNLSVSEHKKIFEGAFDQLPLIVPARRSLHERSMSLPAQDVAKSSKAKKQDWKDEIKKEVVVEQLISQMENDKSEKILEIETKITEKEKGQSKIEESLVSTLEAPDRKLPSTDKAKILVEGVEQVEKMLSKTSKALDVKEIHVEKSETEDNEKESVFENRKDFKKPVIAPVTITLSGKKQTETSSLGESEDTQSESDVTPEEARVLDSEDAPWDVSGTQSGGLSPKDDFYCPKEILEPGIGRWVGQEDLSKQIWEKDDIDASHFKIDAKWQRTRSESASPKEHYIYTPEEHYPDLPIWEVPVQEQLEKEEMTHDIPIEKQIIVEKDEEEEEDDEEENIAHTKKQQGLTEEEAKEIAEEVLEYIQFEVENRSSFLTNDVYEDTNNLMPPQLTDQLRQLADKKNLNIYDVKVIESALSRDKYDSYKKPLHTIDTAASSIDITDEELRSTGAENDISPVESQICKLQSLDKEDLTMITAEMSKKLGQLSMDEESDSSEKEGEKLKLKDSEILDQTIAEVKESLEAAQEQLIEQHKKRKEDILKKESPSEFEFKNITYDKFISGEIKENSKELEGIREYETITEEAEAVLKEKNVEVKDLDKEIQEILNEKTRVEKNFEFQEPTLSTAKLTEKISGKKTTDENINSILCQDIKIFTQMQNILGTSEITEKTEEILEMNRKTKSDIFSDKKPITESELESENQKEEEIKRKEVVKSAEDEDKRKLEKDSSFQKSAKIIKTAEENMSKQILLLPTITRAVDKTKIVGNTSKLNLTADGKLETDVLKNLEIQTEAYSGIKGDRHSSEESPKSASIEDSTKSATIQEDGTSTSSMDKHFDTKPLIKLRHSSSAAVLKGDRRSGTDLEPYSSSGESHYHSFEQAPSRPCSSDVEALVAGTVGTAGSSEYESAVSQEVSSKQATSTDYHTAVSSLSSRESIKSLDSESSGNLASVEVSSEASETLIQSTLELDKDGDTLEMMAYDDENRRTPQIKKTKKPQTQKTEECIPFSVRKSLPDEDFEIISESEIVSWECEASEDEEGTAVAFDEGTAVAEEVIPDEDHIKKMKRSYEMTFQPEPKPIAFSDSLDEFSKDNFIEKVPLGQSLDESSSILSIPDDRLASSLEDSGSILSTSLSTTSELSAVRTVVELSRIDLEKLDESLTVSGTSLDSISRDDFDIKGVSPPRSLTNEISTSTSTPGIGKKLGSVTISTSTSEEHGVSYVSTQVTSISRKSSIADENKTERRSSSQSLTEKPGDKLLHANGPTQVDYVPDYDEIETTRSKKSQGHRRKESTSNFVPTMMWNLSEARPQNIMADFTETENYKGDKYVYDMMLTEKEVKNDEKKEADDSEKFESSLEKYAQERKISEGEEVEELKDYDNRPLSPISKTDSETGKRPVSSVFSEDRPDSELSDLMKQGSSETEREDPLERPQSPEPEEMENKDITPEFSSEAQASVTELEMEYSGAYSRRDEYASHVSPIREERSDIYFSKKSIEELPESESTHDLLHHQASLESTIAEKHELETGEKEFLEKASLVASPCDVPGITITEHVTPGFLHSSECSQLKEEIKEKKSSAKTPDTPASTSSRTSSTSTDQGREYNLEEVTVKKFPIEILSEEKEVNETKDEKDSVNSPSSDSFEMLDKPDISDEYVIIEEIGREAQENDQEGKSIEITSKKVFKRPKEEKKEEEEEILESPPAPFTRMTDLKYFPQEAESDLFSFDSESPPQPPTRRFVDKLKRKSSKEEKDEIEFDEQIEQSKKWVEMQFQGEQAAKVIGGYGYEVEYERAPLEDIKEEDLNELDGSSKIGSMGSQKESLGSFSSVKDSFSSTPDYDVLAGRKYFTRSGDHDDVSMSSLQEFELIEKKIMENGKKSGSSSSQDSLSSKKLGTSSKSGQGDDISLASLKEFENLENACATVVKMESKAKQEEAILSEIDEGHESQISESESCETVSAVMKEKLESDSEDFDKRMLEIDEIIRQAQSNVEKFSELQALEKIESMGRGDSYEEVAKVPDLELDMPLSGRSITDIQHPIKTTLTMQVIPKQKTDHSKELEKTDNIKQKPKDKDSYSSLKYSEVLCVDGKVKSISVDSLEMQTKEKQTWLEEKYEAVSLDSYERKPQKSDTFGLSAISPKSDSIDEVCAFSTHQKSSSGDHSLDTGREDSGDLTYRQPSRSDLMMGSTDSLDPSSSAGTHATYQYETDSVMSSSFTSGDSNTMVSSTDNLEHLMAGQSVIDFSKEFGSIKPEEWLEDLTIREVDETIQKLEDQIPSAHKKFETTEIQKVIDSGTGKELSLAEDSLGPEEEIIEMEEVDKYGNVHRKKILRQKYLIKPGDPGYSEIKEKEEKELKTKETVIHTKKLSLGSDEGFVTETVEPLHDGKYSHIVHRRTQMVPEIEKITFTGPDADKSLKEYMENLKTGEEVEETEEVDEDGNVHVKRVIRQRILVMPEQTAFKEPLKIIRKTTEMPLEVEKLSFTGPNADEAFKKYAESLKPEEEIIETQEEDEYGNVRIKKTIRQKILIKPEDMTQDQLEIYKKQTVTQQYGEGPDEEKTFHESISSLPPEGEIQEIEEVDEQGNVYKKKILKQQVVLMPEKPNKIEFDKSQKSEKLNRFEDLPCYVKVEMPTQIQKITFMGADAEEQLQDYMARMEPEEIQEVEEIDEHGNVHIKRVIKQRVIVRPEELQQNLQLGNSLPSSTDIQKLVFKSSDAEEAMEKYIEDIGLGEDVIEVEEEDEYGNLHLKKVLIQRSVVKSEELDGKELTDKELDEYLKRKTDQTTFHVEKLNIGVVKPKILETIESLDDKEFSNVVHKQIEMPPEVHKIIFRGPEADKAYKAYTEAFEPSEDIEETEEVDDEGNVHVKKYVRRKLLIDSKEIEKKGLQGEELKNYLKQLEQRAFPTDGHSIESSFNPDISFSHPLTEALTSSPVKLTAVISRHPA